MTALNKLLIMFTLIISVAGCLPQKKQTQCGETEAFNTTLRTCVPVMGGGTNSLMSISSYLPSSILARSQNDTNPINFQISIINPANEDYNVVWRRNFNGTDYYNQITVNSGGLVAEVFPTGFPIGLNLIICELLNGSNQVVDTQVWNLNITDLPSPYFIGYSNTPGTTININLNGGTTNQLFSVAATSNGVADLTGFVINWSISPNPSVVPAAVSTPLVSGTTNSNFSVDFSAPDAGSYQLIAEIRNGVLVYQTYVWTVQVNLPNKKLITARNLVATGAGISGTAITTAFHNVAYNNTSSFGTYGYDRSDFNFLPVGQDVQANQSNFCVSVQDGDGVIGDATSSVRVRWYLNGVIEIHNTLIPVGPNEVCLTSGGAGTQALMLFLNSNPEVTQLQSIVARVFDESFPPATQEYALSNMNSGLGLYPITWNINVQPQNQAPVIGFTSPQGITCSSILGSTQTGCTVSTDTAIALTFDLVSDDFYKDNYASIGYDPSKFMCNFQLYQNGLPMIGVGTSESVVPDVNGKCISSSLQIPSFGVTGPLNTSLFTYQIFASVSDVGSEITNTIKTSSNLTWSLTVTESNNSLSIGLQDGIAPNDSYIAKSVSPNTRITAPAPIQAANPAVNFATEGESIDFNVAVEDQNRDNFQFTIHRCLDGSACNTVSGSITGLPVTVTRSNDNLVVRGVYSWIIPEDLIPTTTPINTSVATFFKVVVNDMPFTATPLTAERILGVFVRNYNPAPQFGGVPNPAVAATNLKVFSGYPITIFPGTITDSSIPVSENIINQQWFIKNGATFETLNGATNPTLRWTPSSGVTAGDTVELLLCASDGTPVNPLPNTGFGALPAVPAPGSSGVSCQGPWSVDVYPNILNLQAQGVTSNIGSPIAVWQETEVGYERSAYIAFYDDGNDEIKIDKVYWNADGEMKNGVSGFRTVSFAAIDGETSSGVEDLSITGNDDYLFVAYKAAIDLTFPPVPQIRLRRIYIGSDISLKTGIENQKPFDFHYGIDHVVAGPTFTVNTATAGQLSFELTSSWGNGQTLTFIIPEATMNTAVFTGTAGCPTPLSVCVSDPDTSMATFAQKINEMPNATNDRLQGIVASASSSPAVTTLYGAIGSDYLDVSSHIAGKLGKIFIYNNEWHLPFLDYTPGPSQNRIRILKAPVTTHLSTLGVMTANDLISNSVTDFIMDGFDNGADYRTSLAYIENGITKFVRGQYSGGPLIPNGAPINLFSSLTTEADSLRLSMQEDLNGEYYVMAKVYNSIDTLYYWQINKISNALSISPLSGLVTSIATGSTFDLLEQNHLKEINIEAGPNLNEARVLFKSDYSGDMHIYTARINSSMNLTCGLCTPLTLDANLAATTSHEIALTSIFPSMQLGTQGFNPGENIRSILLAAYGISDGGVSKPQFAILNSQIEAIQSTSSDTTGTTGHRPPFFGN